MEQRTTARYLPREGAAMVIALATDFASIRDLQVVVLRDVRAR